MVDMISQKMINAGMEERDLERYRYYSVNSMVNARHPDQSLVDSAITIINDWISGQQAQGSFLSVGNTRDSDTWKRIYGHILFCIKFEQIDSLEAIINGITNDDRISANLHGFWGIADALKLIEDHKSPSHRPG